MTQHDAQELIEHIIRIYLDINHTSGVQPSEDEEIACNVAEQSVALLRKEIARKAE